MTESEMELFVRLLSCAKCLRDCNPEVGMGPSWEMIAEDLASTLSFPVSLKDIGEAVKRAKIHERKRTS